MWQIAAAVRAVGLSSFTGVGHCAAVSRAVVAAACEELPPQATCSAHAGRTSCRVWRGADGGFAGLLSAECSADPRICTVNPRQGDTLLVSTISTNHCTPTTNIGSSTSQPRQKNI